MSEKSGNLSFFLLREMVYSSILSSTLWKNSEEFSTQFQCINLYVVCKNSIFFGVVFCGLLLCSYFLSKIYVSRITISKMRTTDIVKYLKSIYFTIYINFFPQKIFTSSLELVIQDKIQEFHKNRISCNWNFFLKNI